MGAKPFLYNPKLYLPSKISAILNFHHIEFLPYCSFNFKYFIHFFQNIPLSFALYVDRNSLLQGVHVLIGIACFDVSNILSYILPAAAKSHFNLKSDNDLILNI